MYKLLNVYNMPLAHAKRGGNADAYDIGNLVFRGAVHYGDNRTNFGASDIKTRKHAFLWHKSEGLEEFELSLVNEENPLQEISEYQR